MGAFGAFLLAFFAFVGTIMLVYDPSQRLYNWSRGKTRREVEEASKQWIEKNGIGRMVGLGCGYAMFLIIAILYTFVIEPVAIVAAILNNIGNQQLAYVMLVIAGVSWVRSALGFKNISRSKAKTTVLTEDGQEIEGVVMDTPLDLPDYTWMQVRRVIFALPTLYLWYLFFTVIGIL